MPRPRKLNVDRLELLRSIIAAFDADLAEVTAEMESADSEFRSAKGSARVAAFNRRTQAANLRADILSNGINYNLRRFANRELTASERVRYQETIRGLEVDQLVIVQGIRATRIRPTDAGRAAVATAETLEAVAS